MTPNGEVAVNASQRAIVMGLALLMAMWATGCTAGPERSEPRRTPTASSTSSHLGTSEPKAEPTPPRYPRLRCDPEDPPAFLSTPNMVGAQKLPLLLT